MADNEKDMAFDLALTGAQNLREEQNREWIIAWHKSMRRAFKGIRGAHPRDRMKNLDRYRKSLDNG